MATKKTYVIVQTRDDELDRERTKVRVPRATIASLVSHDTVEGTAVVTLCTKSRPKAEDTVVVDEADVYGLNWSSGTCGKGVCLDLLHLSVLKGPAETVVVTDITRDGVTTHNPEILSEALSWGLVSPDGLSDIGEMWGAHDPRNLEQILKWIESPKARAAETLSMLLVSRLKNSTLAY